MSGASVAIATSSIYRRHTHDGGSSGFGSPKAPCHFTFRPPSTTLRPHAFVPIPPQNGPPSHSDMTLLAHVSSLERVRLEGTRRDALCSVQGSGGRCGLHD